MDIDINKAGYYAGYIASSMMIGRLLSSVFWGRMSDRIGRKPVMYIGCLSIAVFSILFGFSVNFWMALITRFLLGLFNPVMSIARTTICEVCAPKYQAVAMSLNIGCWSVGLVIGPAIGGLLSKPVTNFPELFGNSELLKRFPYLIPNLVTACLASFSLVLLALMFPETLSKSAGRSSSVAKTSISFTTNNSTSSFAASTGRGNKRSTLTTHSYEMVLKDSSEHSTVAENPMHLTTNGDVESKDDVDDDNVHKNEANLILGGYTMVSKGGGGGDDHDDLEVADDDDDNVEDNNDACEQVEKVASAKLPPLEKEQEVHYISTYELYTTNGVWQSINTNVLLSLVSSTINELVPLWAVASRSNGGLDFTSVVLGKIMTITGLGLFFCTVFLYPIMVSNFGVRKTYLIGVFCMSPVLTALSFSSSHYLRLNDNEEFTVVVSILLLVKVCDSCTFASLSTIINQTVDSSKRGLINGLAMTLVGIGQSIGAVLAAVGFAWSINNDMAFPFDQHFMFLNLSGICILNGILFYILVYRSPLASNQGSATTVFPVPQQTTITIASSTPPSSKITLPVPIDEVASMQVENSEGNVKTDYDEEEL